MRFRTYRLRISGRPERWLDGLSLLGGRRGGAVSMLVQALVVTARAHDQAGAKSLPRTAEERVKPGIYSSPVARTPPCLLSA